MFEAVCRQDQLECVGGKTGWEEFRSEARCLLVWAGSEVVAGR